MKKEFHSCRSARRMPVLRLIAFKWVVCLSDFAWPGNALLFFLLVEKLRLHNYFCLKEILSRKGSKRWRVCVWFIAKLDAAAVVAKQYIE